MTSKTDRFVVAARPSEQLAYHDYTKLHPEDRTSKMMMDSSLVPEADITVVGGRREIKPGRYWPVPEPHKHEVNELYMILGDLTVEVILDGEGHEVTGPTCVFIPAGMMHTIRMIRGSGYSFAILRAGKYE